MEKELLALELTKALIIAKPELLEDSDLKDTQASVKKAVDIFETTLKYIRESEISC